MRSSSLALFVARSQHAGDAPAIRSPPSLCPVCDMYSHARGQPATPGRGPGNTPPRRHPAVRVPCPASPRTHPTAPHFTQRVTSSCHRNPHSPSQHTPPAVSASPGPLDMATPTVLRSTRRYSCLHATDAAAAHPTADPHVWLEEVSHPECLAFAREANTACVSSLFPSAVEDSAEYRKIKKVLDCRDKIPAAVKHGGLLYNLWTDEANPKGLCVMLLLLLLPRYCAATHASASSQVPAHDHGIVPLRRHGLGDGPRPRRAVGRGGRDVDVEGAELPGRGRGHPRRPGPPQPLARRVGRQDGARVRPRRARVRHA